MPDCERMGEVGAYCDGELSGQERARMAAHIEQCPACARELERLGALSRLLAGASVPEMRPLFLAQLHRRVAPAREVGVLRFAQRLMAVAAAVLVGCCMWLWYVPGPGGANGGPTEGWESAALALQVEMPVDVSPDEQLAEWIVQDLLQENGGD